MNRFHASRLETTNEEKRIITPRTVIRIETCGRIFFFFFPPTFWPIVWNVIGFGPTGRSKVFSTLPPISRWLFVDKPFGFRFTHPGTDSIGSASGLDSLYTGNVAINLARLTVRNRKKWKKKGAYGTVLQPNILRYTKQDISKTT